MHYKFCKEKRKDESQMWLLKKEGRKNTYLILAIFKEDLRRVPAAFRSILSVEELEFFCCSTNIESLTTSTGMIEAQLSG